MLNGRGGDGRDVLDEQYRQAFAGEFVHRPQAEAVAVGVSQVLVNPTTARQAGGGKLARRERDLAVNPVDPVAVVIHALEVVVSADLLELGEGGQQRFVVPHADVAEGRLVLPDVVQAQIFDGGEFALLEAVQGIRLAGEFDGVGDEGRVPGQFHWGPRRNAGRSRGRSIRRAPPRPPEDPGKERRPQASPLRPGRKRHSCQQAKEEFDFQNGQGGVHVGVPRAIDEPARRIEQAVHGQANAIGEDHKEHAPSTIRCARAAPITLGPRGVTHTPPSTR